MLIQPTRNVSASIICDIPINIIGLRTLLEFMSITVDEVRTSISFLTEITGLRRSDAIIIDLNTVNLYLVLSEILKTERKGIRVIVFSEGVWINKDNMTFIHRGECIELIKSYLLMGVFSGYGISPKLTRVSEFSISDISIMEFFVLKEWFLGRALSVVAKKCNRSVKTISAHKRNAMKKLMVGSNRELYHMLRSLY